MEDDVRALPKDDCFQALSSHHFFRGLRKEAVGTLARASKRYLGHAGEVIFTERSTAEASGSCLWVLHRGSVAVSESGEKLGTLEANSVFGDSVAFERCDTQPFTISVNQVPMLAFCVPIVTLLEVMAANPTVVGALEEIMDAQMRQLLLPRVSEMVMFSHCSANFLKQLIKWFTVRHIVAGLFLWPPGKPLDTMEVLVAGRVRICKYEAERERTHAGVHGAHSTRVVEAFRHLMLGGMPPIKQSVQKWKQRIGKADTPESPQAEGHVTPEGTGMPHKHARLKFSPEVQNDHKESDEDSEQKDAESDDEDSESSDEDESDSGFSEDSAWTHSSEEQEDPSMQEHGTYSLPGSLARLEPEEDSGLLQVAAGRQCFVWGEQELLFDSSQGLKRGKSSNSMQSKDSEKTSSPTSPTRVNAGCQWIVGAETNSIVLSLSRTHFNLVKSRAVLEKKRFNQLGAAGYKEWERCGIHNLRSVKVFSNCTANFLIDLAQAVTPKLVFPGQDDFLPAGDANGSEPTLVLLMSGRAEMTEDGKKSKVQAPESLGVDGWLSGDSGGTFHLKAKEVCQVLTVTRSQLLCLIENHPADVSKMVSKAQQGTNSRRGSKGRNSNVAVSSQAKMSHNNVLWCSAFCSDLGAPFFQAAKAALDCLMLVPGQPLLRRKDQDDETDFVVVLLKGAVKVQKYTPGQELKEINTISAPVLICGFDKSSLMEARAETFSEVHRMTIGRCKELATDFPEETRVWLERMTVFQERLESRTGLCWWSSLNVLRRHEPFSVRIDSFLDECAPLLQVRFVMPGEAVVVEDSDVTHALLLESGEAHIKIRKGGGSASPHDRAGKIQDSYLIGGIGGAYGFAGMQKRACSITATTVCKVISIPIKDFHNVLERNPKARQLFREIAERRLRELAPERLEEHEFFSGFNKQMMNSVRAKCHAKVVFAGEAIVRQGDINEGMVIISAGTVVTMLIDGSNIKETSDGAIIGVEAVLTPTRGRHYMTIVSKTACAVRVLRRSDWLEVLKTNPDHRLWMQAFVDEQLERAETEFQEHVKRRNWERIRQRESVAKRKHLARSRGGENDVKKGKSPRRHLYRTAAGTPGFVVPLPPKKQTAPEDARERWECFNGHGALMPSIRLPMLRDPENEEEDSDESDDQPMDSHASEAFTRQVSDNMDDGTVNALFNRRTSGGRISIGARSSIDGRRGSLERPSDRRGSLKKRASLLGAAPDGLSRKFPKSVWLDCQEVLGVE